MDIEGVQLALVKYVSHTQQKQHAIAGSAITQNNIRHYIKPMPPRSSGIIQLGYLLINAVGHFMIRLNTKHTRLYIKTYPHRCGFCSTTAPHTPPYQSPFSFLPLR